MSPTEKKALAVLAEAYSGSAGYCTFDYVASHSSVPREKVRRTVRSLARKGLAEYGRGLWTEDGEPFGSGYKCTAAGLHIYQTEIFAGDKHDDV